MKSDTAVVYLTGKPGVGKYTIASELAHKHKLIVCDNQLINNPIFELLQYDGMTKIPDFAWDSIAKIRKTVLEFLSKEHQHSYILTNCLAETKQDRDLFEQVEAVATARASIFVPVRLVLSKEEHLRRLTVPERRKRWKSIDPRDAEDNGPLLSISHKNYLELDVTSLSAAKAAERIMEFVNNLTSG